MSDESGSTVSGSNPQSSAAKTDSEDDEDKQISFCSYQIFVFVSCYTAYSILLYNRKSFVFALPHLLLEQYMSSYEVGMILSTQTITYTFSRFFSSWATDHYTPKLMLAGGLFFSGVVMLSLADQEDWVNIVLLYTANGVAQGMGWPAVSKMIRAWFPPTQFGLWYALVCTVPNAIATVGPNLAAGLCVNYGWRVSVQIPALIALFASPIVGYVAVDRPSDVGYEDQLSLSGGVLQGHWSDLAGSDFMALLASTLCLLSLVKTTCMEWGSTYLTNDRGVSSYFSSSYLVAMDVGGILGSIVVGACTDFMVARQYYLKTGQSPRMIVVQLCVAGSCLFLNLLIFSIDPDTERGYIVGVGFCLGFCIYGAISLLGTVTIEVAPIHITGAAHAIVGVASNVGSIVAGIPIKHIANTWSWYHVFLGLNIVSTLVFLFLIVGKEINASYLTHTTGGPAKLRKL